MTKKCKVDFATGDITETKPAFKINNHYNYLPLKQAEKFKGESKTIPDQAMTLKELMTRYVNGYPLHLKGQQPVFHGDEDLIPDYEHMDLAEKEALMDQYREELKITNQRIAWNKKKKEQIDKKAAEMLAQEELDKKFLEKQEAELGFRNPDSKNKKSPPSPMKTD